MIFDKEETKNLLQMLKAGEDNAHIAFQSLENSDLSNYFGELLVLYKHSKLGSKYWEENAPECWKMLEKHVNTSLTSGKCLSILTEMKCSKVSIELFLENFVVDMVTALEQIGYPTNKFEINISLKDE
jgi:hypothetical protein